MQRLPALLNEVHRFIEEKGLRFVLCGSSARKLKQAGVNLLAGRALYRAMHPFIPEELGERFALDDALQHGLLPIVWDSEDRAETLIAYTQMYLKEEIQAEALVRNLPGFARFLPVAALFHGQTLNVTNIARDAQVARTTVTGYLEILEETLLCFQLPAYETRLRVRERKLPKWYWCDPGIVRAMKKVTTPPTPEERGVLFEGLIAQLIRSYTDYRNLCDECFYWGTVAQTQTEVDFLLKRGGEFVAIEVKSGSTFAESWCKGLRVLADLEGCADAWSSILQGPSYKRQMALRFCHYRNFPICWPLMPCGHKHPRETGTSAYTVNDFPHSLNGRNRLHRRTAVARVGECRPSGALCNSASRGTPILRCANDGSSQRQRPRP